MTTTTAPQIIGQYLMTSIGLLLIYNLFKDNYVFIAIIALILFIGVQLLHVFGLIIVARKVLKRSR